MLQNTPQVVKNLIILNVLMMATFNCVPDAEAQACVGFARIMLLLAVQSWFDWDSDDGFATWGWASQLGVGAGRVERRVRRHF